MGTYVPEQRRRRAGAAAGAPTARRSAPRRLLWVNHFAVTPDMGGGTRHFELGRELGRRGWEVTVLASDYHLHRREYMRRAGPDAREPVREHREGVDFEWLHATPYRTNDLRRIANWLSFSRALLRREDLGERPDLVIGSTPHLFAALAAYRLARRYRVPFVLEIRDLWPETLAVAGRRRGPGYFGLWALARFLYRVADRIVVLAGGVEEYLEQFGVPRERMVFIPNGVDLGAFEGARPAERDTLRLVYAGAHGPANGLDAVLDAAAILRDEPRVRFVLVGDGPARESLRARAAQMRLGNVEFRDALAKSEIPRFLAACDAGLMVLKHVPVFSFGVSPNKLFDYWGASLPVICNVPGEVASLVADAGGGLQAEGPDGAALASAVRALLERSPRERRAMGDAGHAWVRRERDRARLAARLDSALCTLLPRH